MAGKGWLELTSSEVVQRAEAAAELGVAQSPVAEERAQMLFGGAFPFLRVAIETAGDEVAVGIAPRVHAWHNVIQAAPAVVETAQSVKATAAFALVDGTAQRLGLQEIRVLDAERGAGHGRRRTGGDFCSAHSANFFGKP